MRTADRRDPNTLVVLGAGITGLAAALFAAASRPVVVVARQPPAAAPATAAAAVEAVPAPLLTLLLELGIHPAELDVATLHSRRRVAWESPRPETLDGRAAAHIARHQLLAALSRRARGHPRISFAARPDGTPPLLTLDATGRAPVTAGARLGPIRPWFASWVTVPRGSADPALHIAAAPTGYAYRLGSANHLTVGWTAPGPVPIDGAGLLGRLRAGGTCWILDDIDAGGLLAAPVAHRQASLSIPLPARPDGPGAPLPIGDAALTRDALASQGTSLGLSDARLGVGPDISVATRLLDRHAESYTRHISTMRQLVDSCHGADQPEWRSYAAWLADLPPTRPVRARPPGRRGAPGSRRT